MFHSIISLNLFNQNKESVIKESEEVTTVPVICHCGKASKLRTSWTDENPGRRFFCCENYGEINGCGFFLWYDKPMCEQSTWVIPRLLRNVKMQEAENIRRKHRERLLWFALAGSWILVLFKLLSKGGAGAGQLQHGNEL